MTNNVQTVAQLSQKGRRSLYYVATGLAQYPGARSKASLRRLSSLGLVDSWKKPHEAKLTPIGEKIATDAGWRLKGDGAQLALFDGPDKGEPKTAPIIMAKRDPVAPAVEARPVLRWCGGKGDLLGGIIPEMPAEYGRLFVPFVGGAALVFALPGRVAYMSDANTHLINAYRCIRDNVEDVIAALQEHKSDDVYYYPLRDSFNEGYGDPLWRAAAFIYMNRVCFNGVCRYNRKGGFNVPWGKNFNATICDADNLRACSEVLQGVEIEADDFRAVEDKARPGDAVYLDPVYVEENKDSFTGYWGKWDDKDHADVAALFRRLVARGVHVLASNSDTAKVRELYDGFEMRTLTRANSINSKASARGGKSELLILGGTWTPRGAS